MRCGWFIHRDTSKLHRLSPFIHCGAVKVPQEVTRNRTMPDSRWSSWIIGCAAVNRSPMWMSPPNVWPFVVMRTGFKTGRARLPPSRRRVQPRLGGSLALPNSGFEMRSRNLSGMASLQKSRASLRGEPCSLRSALGHRPMGRSPRSDQ